MLSGRTDKDKIVLLLGSENMRDRCCISNWQHHLHWFCIFFLYGGREGEKHTNTDSRRQNVLSGHPHKSVRVGIRVELCLLSLKRTILILDEYILTFRNPQDFFSPHSISMYVNLLNFTEGFSLIYGHFPQKSEGLDYCGGITIYPARRE